MVCTTNPEVFGAALRNLRAIYDLGYDAVELGQSDGYRRCTCGFCEAMDDYRPSVGWMVPHRPADRIHAFHQRLAQAIGRSHPSRDVIIIAYGPTGAVPRRVAAFPENVIVEYTHSPPELLKRWTAYHGRFVAYVYWFGMYRNLLYAPKSSPFLVASEVQRMREAGADGFYFCGGGGCWGVEAPSYYVVARLLRDPRQGAGAVLDEFCRGLFGAAAAPMRQFFGRFLTAADRCRTVAPCSFEPGVPFKPERRPVQDYYLACFTDEVLSECDTSLTHAATTATDRAAKTRVQFFRDGFDYVALTTRGFARLKQWQEQPSRETRAALERVVAERNRFVLELLDRQALNARDLPPVFAATQEHLLYGGRGLLNRPFKTHATQEGGG